MSMQKTVGEGKGDYELKHATCAKRIHPPLETIQKLLVHEPLTAVKFWMCSMQRGLLFPAVVLFPVCENWIARLGKHQTHAGLG